MTYLLLVSILSLGKYFLDIQIEKFNNKYVTGEGSGITLTNNEINDIL